MKAENIKTVAVIGAGAMGQQIAMNTALNGREKGYKVILCDSFPAAIEKATKDMFDSINMLNGMWEGSAHDAFLQAVKSDKQAVEELNQTIGDLLGCFEYAKKQYNNCENSVHQIVQSISV